MGCDIHCYAERRNNSGKLEIMNDVLLFRDRNYRLFGFIADVRNYSDITPIAQLRGIPIVISEPVAEIHASWECDAHSASWLSVDELSTFNYDAECEDRRVTRKVDGIINGGCTCLPGEGKTQTYRDFLGEWFFDDLDELQKSGAERIVFWFDS